MNDIERIISEISEYEKQHGEDKSSISAKADLLEKTGDYSGSAQMLERAYNLDKTDLTVMLTIAEEYEKAGDYAMSTVYYALATNEFERQGNAEDLSNVVSAFDEATLSRQEIFTSIRMNSGKTFVFASICGFSQAKQRYQNLAVALVQAGNRVIYICPSIQANSKELLDEDKLAQMSIISCKLTEGVEVYQPYYDSLTKANGYDKMLAVFMAEYPQAIVVVSDVSACDSILKYSGSHRIIFDCADDNTDLKNAFWSCKQLLEKEETLVNTADYITCTATSLFLKKACIEGRENVFLSRNAVSASEMGYGSIHVIPDDMQNIPHPIVTYIGVIYQRFDRELFYTLAKNNPDKSFVIIGTVIDNYIEKKYDNIYFLGAKPHSALGDYYSNSDICIIPYKDDAKMSMSCDPVKIHEQIAMNVPTVTTYMPDTAMDRPLCYHANTVEGFQQAFDEILADKKVLDTEELNDYIVDNSWIRRACQLMRIADDSILPHETTLATVKELQNKLSEICDEHTNYGVLYGLSLYNDDMAKCAEYIAKAYNADKSDYNTEMYKLVTDNDRPKKIDIFNPPKNLPDDFFVEIQWLNTFWCNNDCPYCHMGHDRKLGHAFDVATPDEWFESFKAIKVPFFLNITGGEAMLDIDNFSKLYNKLVTLKNLVKVRIDSNLTMPADVLKKMNIDRTVLMTSHHPSRFTPQQTISQAKKYREIGFDVSMINMVCRGDDMQTYKKLRPEFEKQGFPLAVSVYFGEDAKWDNTTINAYSEIVDKTDIGFKTFFNTKGLKCHAAESFISLSTDGTLSNCWGERKKIFDKHFNVSDKPRECPMQCCNCIEKYSMLDCISRDKTNSLKEYIDTYRNGGKTKIVLIEGYFGHDNFGDELLLESLLQRVRSMPDCMPIVAGFDNPEKIAAEHNVVAISLQNKEKVAQACCLCDCLIIGPGGLIDDTANVDPIGFFRPSGTYTYLYPAMLAKMNSKPVFTIGLGVKEITRQEVGYTVNTLFNQFDFIGVRDDYSAQCLKSVGVKNPQTFADMAFAIDVTSDKKSDGKTLGINLRYVHDMDLQAVVMSIGSLACEYLAKNWQIKFILLQENVDRTLVEKIVETINRQVSSEKAEKIFIVCPDTIQHTADELASVDYLVAMRLHANIIGAKLGVPSVFLCYDEKVSNAAKLLGMADYSVDMSALNYDIISNKLGNLCNYNNSVKMTLKANCDKLSTKAASGWEELKKLIQ